MIERMYVVKAHNQKVDFETSYYYINNALYIIKHLHVYWPDLRCTLSLKNDVDSDFYKYDIDTEVNE